MEETGPYHRDQYLGPVLLYPPYPRFQRWVEPGKNLERGTDLSNRGWVRMVR